VAVLARLTARRLFRTRSAWISVGLAVLPVGALAAFGMGWTPDGRWDRVFSLLSPMLAVLVPYNLASVVAEEAEEETYSFLWARPIPRWTITAGKAAALLPFVTALVIAAIAASWALSFGGASPGALARGVAAAIAGCLATAALAAALGTLIRKQAVAVSAGYLLMIDFPMGNIPLSISNLSITGHFKDLATGEALARPLVWLAAMTAAWAAVALWRVGSIELSNK
jgi:ABC-type transport system involved in multi-copper enzyme maturation permease subunit